MSQWNVVPLSANQQLYAAIDVYVSNLDRYKQLFIYNYFQLLLQFECLIISQQFEVYVVNHALIFCRNDVLVSPIIYCLLKCIAFCKKQNVNYDQM